jgi:hypothetical protein
MHKGIYPSTECHPFLPTMNLDRKSRAIAESVLRDNHLESQLALLFVQYHIPIVGPTIIPTLKVIGSNIKARV